MARLSRDGAVYVLDLGEDENRFDADSVASIMAALDEVATADGPRSLVTSAGGKFFSNGLDLEWLGAHQEEWLPFVGAVQEMLARLLTLPVPTAAAVQGHAFAAGAMLTLSHDWVVMRADRGFWCLPEVDIGLPFTPGMDALIRSRLDVRTAHDAITTGRRYGGHEALAAGIIDDVADADSVLAAAIERVGPLSAKAGPTLGTIKATHHARALQALRAA
jgi:enoyl-CoA hydratase/carnithine racemase